jgi:hypothetical protein
MPATNTPQQEAIDFPITGYFDRQRFRQFNPSDAANWYLLDNPQGKKKLAMYPVMGRRHVRYLGQNRLIFVKEPRAEFKSVNFAYEVVSNAIFRIDKLWNQIDITGGQVTTLSGDVFFAYLVTPGITFAVFVDGQHIYVYNENTGVFSVVTDPNAPANPKFIAAFGNRIVVSSDNSSEFRLSEINLGGSAFNPATCFTISSQAIFAQEAGIIRQMGVLHNTLYIFTDFTTGIWSNKPSVFISAGGTPTTFPWSKNTTYDWDFGMADPKSLDIDFGRMAWIAQNRNGLIQVMTSSGEAPKRISTRAVDILFQRSIRQGVIGNLSPFLSGKADGFLYQYENTIFYRTSAGEYTGTGILDVQTNANSIEYNFETETWHRVIEKNGERNRIQKHIYFNNTHLVTVQGDSTVYEMSGQFYDNEITNADREDPQEPNAYLREPFRYERVTPIIADDDYGEFITDWVQIDFVWGESFNIFSESPFANAQFLIDEAAGADGEPQYIIDDPGINGNPVYILSEEGNISTSDEIIYNNIYKPHIELYWSDDGGVSFEPADVREFSQLGVYSWRMRWYQLGASRNRCYMLVCVSNSPIVVLGGIMMTRRASDGSA